MRTHRCMRPTWNVHSMVQRLLMNEKMEVCSAVTYLQQRHQYLTVLVRIGCYAAVTNNTQINNLLSAHVICPKQEVGDSVPHDYLGPRLSEAIPPPHIALRFAEADDRNTLKTRPCSSILKAYQPKLVTFEGVKSIIFLVPPKRGELDVGELRMFRIQRKRSFESWEF